MSSVAEILKSIPAETTVVAVSKFQTSAAIRRLHAEFSLQNFGENYVQEAQQKQDELRSLDLNWHFIGRLQKNKVKAVVGSFALIHSVDSSELAERIDKCAEEKKLKQKILLQMNLAEEVSKGGFHQSEIEEVFRLKNLKNISVIGLMTMPPLTDNPEKTRPYFRELRNLISRFQTEFPECHELSMGTSADYRVAIEEGATLVRLGTLLFGQRPEKN